MDSRRFILTAYDKNGDVLFTETDLPLFKAESRFYYWMVRIPVTRIERVKLTELV